MRYPEHDLCSHRVWGSASTSQKNTRAAVAVRVFFVFVGTHALLASYACGYTKTLLASFE